MTENFTGEILASLPQWDEYENKLQSVTPEELHKENFIIISNKLYEVPGMSNEKHAELISLLQSEDFPSHFYKPFITHLHTVQNISELERAMRIPKSFMKTISEVSRIRSSFNGDVPAIMLLSQELKSILQSPFNVSQQQSEYIFDQMEAISELYHIYTIVERNKSYFTARDYEELLSNVDQKFLLSSEIPLAEIRQHNTEIEKYIVDSKNNSKSVSEASDISNNILFQETQLRKWSYQSFFRNFSILYNKKLYSNKTPDLQTPGQLSINFDDFKDIVSKMPPGDFEYDIYFTLLWWEKISYNETLDSIWYVDTENTISEIEQNKQTDKSIEVDQAREKIMKDNETHIDRLFQLIHHRNFPRIVGKKTHPLFQEYIHDESIETQWLSDIIQDFTKQDVEEIKNVLSYYLSVWSKQSLEIVEMMYEQEILSSDDAYTILWGEKWFMKHSEITLTDLINILGTPASVKDSLENLLWRKISAQELENLEIFNKMTLRCESYWGRNVLHSTWASSAENVYQFLAGDGKYKMNKSKKRYWATSSFETALVRGNKQWVLSNFPQLETAYLKRWPKNPISPKMLNVQESMVLFYANLYARDKFTFLKVMSGDTKSPLQLYWYEHHTNMDDGTMNLLEKAYTEYYGKNVTIERISSKPIKYSFDFWNNENLWTSTVSRKVDSGPKKQEVVIAPGAPVAATVLASIKLANPSSKMAQSGNQESSLKHIMLQLSNIGTSWFVAGKNIKTQKVWQDDIYYRVYVWDKAALEIDANGNFKAA